MLQDQQEAESKHRDLNNELRSASNQLQKLKADRALLVKGGPGGKLGLYGNRIEEVLRSIQSEKGFRSRVFGPLGMFVKLDPQFKTFGRAIENGIGSRALRSFLVTCIDDKNRLARIFQNYGLLETSNIVVQQSCPKYNVTRPPVQGAVTILDALVIEESSVFNALIDMSSIESILLVNSEEEFRQNFMVILNGRKQLKYPGITKAVSA